MTEILSYAPDTSALQLFSLIVGRVNPFVVTVEGDRFFCAETPGLPRAWTAGR